jgi:ATP-dependent Clp protease ATP-binding subunit ClpC
MPYSFNFFLSNFSSFFLAFSIILLLIFLFFLNNKKIRIGGDNFKIGTPTLDQFSRDLNRLASEGKLDPVIGRQEEIERVIQILCRRTKNNPVLVGKAGVGKTAIAEGLAQAIVDKKVPEILQHKRVLALDLPAIVAGTKYRGEFEKRLKQVTDEIISAKRSIILFIDEIHTLAEAGGAEGAIDADDILKPALARGDLQVIGATTFEEYREFIKKDVTLDRRLHPVLVDEPTKEETTEILRGIKRKYEQFHHVNINDEAILAIVHFAAEKIKNKSFPDKAIDLMDEASSKVSIDNIDSHNKSYWPRVGVAEVQAVIQEWEEDKVI